MRFQLVAALALIASSASASPNESGQELAQRAEAIQVGARAINHSDRRSRRANHAHLARANTRKCRPKARPTNTDSAVASSETTANSGTATPDEQGLWQEPPATDSTASSSETSAEAPASTPPAPNSNSGTSPAPGNPLDFFSTDGGAGTFAQMSNAAINDKNKYAYGNLKDNGDGTLTFTFEQGSLSTNTRDSWYYYTTQDPGNTGMDLSAAKTATFTYSVKFQNGFDFNMGGKLPGWYGGESQADAKECTGHNGRSSCFSSRVMWRQNGQGEIYNYYWPTKQAYCSDPSSYSIGSGLIRCVDNSGDSVGRGAFNFVPGQWLTISNTVTLNSMNGNKPNADGRQVIAINGQEVITTNNLVIRHSEKSRIRGLFFSSFFGGDKSSWASPKHQTVDFKDISVAVLEKL